MSTVVEELFRFAVRVVFDLVMVTTGEIVMWGLTAGRRKPRWDLYTSESPTRFVVFQERSVWVGMATWLLVLVLAWQWRSL